NLASNVSPSIKNAPGLDSTLAVFSAILICLENSFWHQTMSSMNTSEAFLASWKQFIATGTKDRLIAELESLGNYPGALPKPAEGKTDEQRLYESSLVDILLKHRLGMDITPLGLSAFYIYTF
ncbi:hypothetical protein CVT26_001446, partial [Gymnopilus dilepis]